MPDRVIVYIDAQNVYRCARDSFSPLRGERPHVHGQVDPLAIGNLICSRPPAGLTRTLSEVRVYTGRPESSKQPRIYAAHMRQCAAWEAAGVKVIARTLLYPTNWPDEKPREKGIDVALAIDFVAGAVEGRYDVGVIFSTDTDLRPALEFVTHRFDGVPRAESAAWRAPGANRALTVRNPRRTWCHYLDPEDYKMVHDPRDYNIV
ncbi:MAG: hypothetical protein AMXMBFR80_28980 [Dehalococcoidia bacterium]|nr:NYN domain-containing protein [Tepidiformaceae bacterium]